MMLDAIFHGRSGQLVLEQFKRDYPNESNRWLMKERRTDAIARREKEKAGHGVVLHVVIFGDRYAKYKVDLAAGTVVCFEVGFERSL